MGLNKTERFLFGVLDPKLNACGFTTLESRALTADIYRTKHKTLHKKLINGEAEALKQEASSLLKKLGISDNEREATK